MTGILIVARLGSTRLSQKHLIKVGEKTFIEWLVSRFAAEFKSEIDNNHVKLIVASSIEPENRQFENVLRHYPVSVFYGHDSNIPQRQIECADHYQLKNIISVDGDDILCSTNAARKAYECLNTLKHDYVKSTNLPLGMNIMGYSTDFLKNILSSNAGKLETGWGRIFENKIAHEIVFPVLSENSDLRFTLDYQLDADFFTSVINFLGNQTINISDEKLIAVVLENKFHLINISLNETYWNNFNAQKNSEINN
jgi:spore coat polysaccharide biosynthesis protein SpsF (cytidylyltransferase family)